VKSLFARIGGTRLEAPALKISAAVVPLFHRSLNDPRPFWIREGVSTQQKLALSPIQDALLTSGFFFKVPAQSWLIEPLAVSAKQLTQALEFVAKSQTTEILWSIVQPNLSYDSDWLVLRALEPKILKQATKGEVQLAFAPKATLGTSRRLVPLEVWKQNSHGNLVSPAWNGKFTEISGDFKTSEDLDFAGQTKNLYDVPYAIDAVYLWVDGSDPSWLAKKAKYQDSNSSLHGSAASRFISRNELYFSLRSLLQHAAWINRIWIVTDGQKPELGELGDRVTIVDHRDFIPEEYLPTFNSHAITANLHRIDGLSEHFLYLNDDIFFGRNLHPGIWFDTLGRSVIRYTRTLMPGKSVSQPELIHTIRHNTVALAASRGLRVTTRSIQHGPHPLQRGVMEKLWSEFRDEFDQTCKNRFRAETDLVPEWLHNFAAISSGRGFLGGKLTYTYIVINARSSLSRIIGLFFRRVPSVLCLNDVSELKPEDLASEAVVENRIRVITKLLESDR
jgi:hypothetical protein